MSGKRKDNRGRILRTGESQRKDGLYMYRFADSRGKRQYVYASTLDELRRKEHDIQRDIEDGINYAAGEMTVVQLMERYISQKQGVSENTKKQHRCYLNLVKNEDFGGRIVKMVKPSDGKAFFMKLYEAGLSYGTISHLRGVLRPAFAMAIEDDILRRNPFSFSLVDVIPNNPHTKGILTHDEQERLLAYFLADKRRSLYYDDIVILLNTGMRISELYGLTIADIDFERRRINVDHQLQRINGRYIAGKLKTGSSRRYVPMLDEKVCKAFQRVIRNRKAPKVEYMVDGYTGFLFLNSAGNPKVADNLQTALKRAVASYNKSHTDKLPHITPHTFRHTFLQ